MPDTMPPMPPMIGGVVPNLALEKAPEAVLFYARAFDAKEVFRLLSDDGVRLMHSHIQINGGSIILNSFFPEYGHAVTPVAGITLYLHVADPQAWWDRAVEAGCEVVMPLAMQFWGQLYGQVRDPFGVIWALGPDA
jgi:PhnB protein